MNSDDLLRRCLATLHKIRTCYLAHHWKCAVKVDAGAHCDCGKWNMEYEVNGLWRDLEAAMAAKEKP